MDEQIVKFEKQIVDDINKSGLPLQVVRLVLLEVQNSVIAECNKQNLEEKEREENGL